MKSFKTHTHPHFNPALIWNETRMKYSPQRVSIFIQERKFNKEAPKKDLRALGEECFTLPFGECMAGTSWSGPELSPEQVQWAAATALVCAHVYAANEQRVQRMVRRAGDEKAPFGTFPPFVL